MRRKFVEYLGTDFFRIPVELSVVSASNTKRTPTKPSSITGVMRNARMTSYRLAGVLVVKLIAMSVSRKVHNTQFNMNNIYL
jgi:anionic cell wall polymer biosynthesis LytR-Cps2A-Psr (LCP) family protein